MPCSIALTFLTLVFSILSVAYSDPRTSVADAYCRYSEGDGNGNEEFDSIYLAVMKALSDRIALRSWASYEGQSSRNSIFGFAQCYGDISQDDCILCIDQAQTKLNRCLPSLAGRVYLDGCFIRYDTYNFSGESIAPSYDSTKCGAAMENLHDVNMQRDFADKLDLAVRRVMQMATLSGGFGAAKVGSGVVSIHTLGQCWNDVDHERCQDCLQNAEQRVVKCIPGAEGRALNAGCYLRYSTHEFYDQTAVNSMVFGRALSRSVVVIIVLFISLFFLMLSLFGVFVGYKRYSMRKKEREQLARIPSTVNKSDLNFKYEMLEQATDCFSSSNKLGQGGAGTVFKGTLPDGRVIAVKRLFFNSRQWADEFFNEVNLISGIRHKNLVKLLGFSIEGPESLLVYEYVANKSLAQLLFDKNRTQTLSWQQRFEIILGIAEGLAHLHYGCREKIIHRDVKNSNILLDENLTPKVADFGLARCVSANKTHISTAIAGTLGYMAPEYLVKGQLSEKTDVYAFGVLSLEITCGRKNNMFVHDSESILHEVWMHYKSDEITKSIDSNLAGVFDENEAFITLHAGLMCTQMSANLRPTMSKVVEMLTEKTLTHSLPKQPPFNNSTFLVSDDRTKKSNSMSSDWHSTHTSSSSSESFVSMASLQSHARTEYS